MAHAVFRITTGHLHKISSHRQKLSTANVLTLTVESLCKALSDFLVYPLSSVCSFLQANTFQCVLATNGTHSFSVFLYADGLVQWTRYQEVADLQDQVTVEVGFNALSAYFSLPTSHTEYVLNITTASNARMPGEWVFRIDEPSGVTFPGTCTIGGLCCVRTSTMNQTCVSFCMLNVR